LGTRREIMPVKTGTDEKTPATANLHSLENIQKKGNLVNRKRKKFHDF
jgi:hypothetical protein